MKKGLYTIFFMTAITIFFISALAFVNEVSRERVAQNQKIQEMKSILYAFNILPEGIDETRLSLSTTTDQLPWDEEQVLSLMEDNVKHLSIPVAGRIRDLAQNSFLVIEESLDIYVQKNENNEIVAYGFPVKGKGLWGTISAFAVVSADLQRMTGIDFTEQSETPGLGARITESWFKYFFRNLNIEGFYEPELNEKPIVMVATKEKSNVEECTNSLQAITGATLTCNGVLNMLNTDLRFYLRLLSENEQLIQQSI